MTAVAEPEVGKARVRKEDARLITGRSRYTDAITPPGTLHIYVVRSPIAHAQHHRDRRDRGPQGARRHRRLHGRRPRRRGRRIALRLADHPGHEGAAASARWPTSTVHFAGEGVAVVVARSAAEARDAAELVEVDYDDLAARARHGGGARRGRHARPPGPGHQRERHLGVRLRRRGHRRQRRRGHRRRRGRPRLGRRPPPLPPAAPDPGVHGAALRASSTRRASSSRSTPPPRCRTSCAR